MKKTLLILLSLVVVFYLAMGISYAQKHFEKELSKISSSENVSANKFDEQLSENNESDSKAKEEATTIKADKKGETTEKATDKVSDKEKNSTTAKPSASNTKKSENKSQNKKKKSKEKKKEKQTKAENACYITIDCSSILSKTDNLKEGHEDFVPQNGIILKKTKCIFNDGDSVFNILEKVCSENGIRLSARDTVYGIYVVGINNLDEFDCGTASGWVYTVNGKSPSYTCGKYKVSVGDEIVFKYVC